MSDELSSAPSASGGGAFDVVALAASAGGPAALSFIFKALPADFSSSIVVVQHLDPRHRCLMAEILSRCTPLHAQQAEEGDRLRAGAFFIASPAHHLQVNSGGVLSLSETELVHLVRPSADLLFESVAASLKEQAIAAVLTGTGRDGGMWIRAIHKMGGTVIAQDEETSEYFGMPGAAIATRCVDFTPPLHEIPQAIIKRVRSENIP